MKKQRVVHTRRSITWGVSPSVGRELAKQTVTCCNRPSFASKVQRICGVGTVKIPLQLAFVCKQGATAKIDYLRPLVAAGLRLQARCNLRNSRALSKAVATGLRLQARCNKRSVDGLQLAFVCEQGATEPISHCGSGLDK